MMDNFDCLPFRPADILLPQNCDLSLWSVVACDQYTSQPEYWQRVDERVGKAPSALRLILPESCLEGPDVETDIMEINNTMTHYLRDRQFRSYPNTLVYVERTLDSGAVRRGLVGMIDLDAYDYEPGTQTPIRATEGTVLERIPPRVAVRKNAPIELPHVMLLADDPQRTVIEPLGEETDCMELLYDFQLMERGGHIRGWALTEEQMARTAKALKALSDPDNFRARYGLSEEAQPLLFAVGDGNHSLATAKACWERAKDLNPGANATALPAKYALVEINNLHDDSLEFEPIHRVVFNADPDELLAALSSFYPDTVQEEEPSGHVLRYVHGGTEGSVTVRHPAAQLPVGTLQNFLDQYLSRHPGTRVDYVHGDDVACQLAQQVNTTAFLLPPMGKEELFPTIVRDGVLPRKTFSMGEAHDKRFYLEARKIRV